MKDKSLHSRCIVMYMCVPSSIMTPTWPTWRRRNIHLLQFLPKILILFACKHFDFFFSPFFLSQYYTSSNQSAHFEPDVMQTNPRTQIWQGHVHEHDTKLIQPRPSGTPTRNNTTMRRVMTASVGARQQQPQHLMENIMHEHDTWWIFRCAIHWSIPFRSHFVFDGHLQFV